MLNITFVDQTVSKIENMLWLTFSLKMRLKIGKNEAKKGNVFLKKSVQKTTNKSSDKYSGLLHNFYQN